MYCKLCGMDSKTTDVCEWCKKPLAGGRPQTHSVGQPLDPLVDPPRLPLAAAPPPQPLGGVPLTGQQLGGSEPHDHLPPDPLDMPARDPLAGHLFGGHTAEHDARAAAPAEQAPLTPAEIAKLISSPMGHLFGGHTAERDAAPRAPAPEQHDPGLAAPVQAVTEQPVSAPPVAASLIGGPAANPQPPGIVPLAGQPLGGQSPNPALNVTQPVADLTQPVPSVRVSLTGEVIEVAPPPAQPAPSAYPNVTQPVGAPNLARTGPYSRAVVGGLPAAAVSAASVHAQLDVSTTPAGERWEKTLAIAMPILVISVFIVHLAPSSFFWIALLDFFAVAMAMGATGAIPSYDDAYLDVGAALMISKFFGPVVSFVVYGIIGLIKQEFNTAILFLLLGHVFIRLVLGLTFSASADELSVIPQIMMFGLASFLSVCVTFAGWILSSFFRPLNE